MAIDIYLETGPRRSWAAALEFPGWARLGKGDDGAIETLDSYRERYAAVAARAGIKVPKTDFAVVATVTGAPSDTEFGVLAVAAPSDTDPLSAVDAKRLAALVRAAWDEFDAIRAVTPEELRKGPRGGGRDREKMVGHVIGAEASYARKLDIKHKQPDNDDTDAIEALRADLLAVLGKASDGRPVKENGWTQRYAARRIAWHVLDHAWEMQDKTP